MPSKIKKGPSPKGETPVIKQEIPDVLRENYMPYAMSVIVSRAIPEIDGFKPAHRKLLYTMFKMGLLTGGRTKSANIVGQTMRLNPHGDAAIYDTMVRLTRGNETLTMPFVDSKGNFGKSYSRNMAYAAPRYTEAKLDKFCTEIFAGITQNAVDMVDNYDGTMKEPVLLPTTFPNILVSPNDGIAVGMASSFCGFNLKEVCETTIAYIQQPKCDLMKTLPGPYFTTGGKVVSSKEELRQVYETGRGPIRLEGVWAYDAKQRVIEITEIPFSTTVEAIIDKILDLAKNGKVQGIADVRDESDLNGLKIAIELKRGTIPDEVMRIISSQTPFSDSFSCNFNLLIDGKPMVLGVREILENWVRWRIDTKKRIISYDIEKKQEKLHLLEGLSKILLNINKAIRIIRGTKDDSAVIPSLIEGFKIDEEQAAFIAEIKLRNLNQDYILKRTAEIDSLKNDIQKLNQVLNKDTELKKLIIADLKNVIKTYSSPRKTRIEYDSANNTSFSTPEQAAKPVTLTLSKNGYLAIQTTNSKNLVLKNGDQVVQTLSALNTDIMLVFTNRQKAYRLELSSINEAMTSPMGYYLASVLSFDQGERVVGIASMKNRYVLLAYENGKAAVVPLTLYEVKGRRHCLKNACSSQDTLIGVCPFDDPNQWFLGQSESHQLAFQARQLPESKTRTNQGIKCLESGFCFVKKLETIPEKGLTRKTLPSVGKAK